MNNNTLSRQIAVSVYLNGFTVIELLVVISIISLLMSILLPALNAVKNQGRQVICKNNLRQLAMANQSYVNEHKGYFIPGALDIYSENLHRWYGVRQSKDDPFDPAQGPLASYLSDKEIACPQKVNCVPLAPGHNDYEYGNGGYGYNLVYIGSQIWQKGYEGNGCKESTKLAAVSRPQETLLFADTAMVKRIGGEPCLIRYAFVEPRFFIVNKNPEPTWAPYPSVHFRHRKQANIAWADGHIDDKKIGQYDGMNADGTISLEYRVGWFEPMDNSLFDLK